jgi:hypothetical protein
VWAILACRTAVLGGQVQACPDGHVKRVWYNSCRHRMGPPCAWLQVEHGLRRQKARLLACDHDHVIFTIPHALNALWLANVDTTSSLQFASVHDTLLEPLGNGKHLGAKPGIIATRHTWTQTLLLHPHLHCLVTGGGLTEAGLVGEDALQDVPAPSRFSYPQPRIHGTFTSRSSITGLAEGSKLHRRCAGSPTKRWSGPQPGRGCLCRSVARPLNTSTFGASACIPCA